MFGREGEVKIGDFGLVTTENEDDAENLIERTVYKGTPSYMAPEQVRSAVLTLLCIKYNINYVPRGDSNHLSSFCFALILWQRSKSSTVYDRKVDIFAFGLICFELLCNIPAGEERTAVSRSETRVLHFILVLLCYQLITLRLL